MDWTFSFALYSGQFDILVGGKIHGKFWESFSSENVVDKSEKLRK